MPAMFLPFVALLAVSTPPPPAAAPSRTTCAFPDAGTPTSNATGPFPALDRPLTCAPGSIDAETGGGTFALPGAAAGFPALTYMDGRATV